MGKNRILYLGILAGSIVFYLAYQQWLAWLILLTVLLLPVLSLLLSLPGLFTLKLQILYPTHIFRGEKQSVKVALQCRFPQPMCRYKIRVQHPLSGSSYWLRDGENYPSDHCGSLVCRIEKAWAYDYMGLFRFRVHDEISGRVIVRPRPMTVTKLPQLEQRIALAWRPKPGGGFGENHELRLYRPGDHLNQIHWKLSAKTGKLTVREPMIPAGRQVILAISLTGTPDLLDRKFRQLAGASAYLLDRSIFHEIRANTGEGMQTFPVERPEELETALDTLLCSTLARQEEDLSVSGAWVYRMGGDAHEE